MKKPIDRLLNTENSKGDNVYQQFILLINALEIKHLSTETVDSINQEVEQLNAITAIDKNFIKATKKAESNIINLVEKNHKIVPKNYYRKLWIALGMTVFGIPLGVAFGLSVGNLGLIGVGLPIGMAIGVGVGSNLDKKAFNEGRQLDFEVKY